MATAMISTVSVAGIPACLSEKMKNNIYNLGLDDANMSKLGLCNKIKNHIPEFDSDEQKLLNVLSKPINWV